MPSTIYLGGKPVKLDPKLIIGSGGEADIYKIGGGMAVKIFKPPNHPDYVGQPIEQAGAKERILIHQRKLRDFPKNLPPMVVTPLELATDSSGKQILGYSMKLIDNAEVLMRYGDRNFRTTVPNGVIRDIFSNLHNTVDLTHKSGVILGDFNDLNVLVSNAKANIIDADSCQWGPYLCNMFTRKFVDPMLCDPNSNDLMMIKQHNQNSDWYAFGIMLFQSLLYVDPYGGVYRPKKLANKILPSTRPLHRITVFNPEVIYPKPAIPYTVLDDDLLQWFHETFEKDIRGIFPINLLINMRWTQCTKCGTVHSRAICPNCNQITPEMIKAREVVTVTGRKITATKIFATSGQILFSAYQDGKINYLYIEDGCIKREDGLTVATNIRIDPLMRFRINGKYSIVAKENQMFRLLPNEKPEETLVDTFGTLPMFDANEEHYYWLQNGQLWRDDRFGPVIIGSVLENQTLFWVGSTFGFGFYKAGELSVYFVFDAKRTGINDSVKLPRIVGKLVDSTCAFANDRCWFLASTQQGGKTINHCWVIKYDGTILGSTTAEAGDGSWLGTIRGKLAAGNFLLTATDDGIIKVQPNGSGRIEKIQEFPDTEPFVDAYNYLFMGQDGLTVVKPKEVWTLKLT